MRCAMYSSWKTEVFSNTLTTSMARVGVSTRMMRRSALAKETSLSESLNLRNSGVFLNISMVGLRVACWRIS